jgi:hypothetical protein
MKNLFFLAMLSVVTMSLTAAAASAQIRWTPDQKAVWKTETAVWGMLEKGQFPGRYLDSGFVEWFSTSPVPVPEAIKKKRHEFNVSTGNHVRYIDFIPVVIWVRGGVAYADYYQTTVSESKDGTRTLGKSRWMDVLVKEKGNWVITGEMGGDDDHPRQ